MQRGGQLFRVPSGGGKLTSLYVPPKTEDPDADQWASNLIVDATDIYFVQQTQGRSLSLVRVPKEEGKPASFS